MFARLCPVHCVALGRCSCCACSELPWTSLASNRPYIDGHGRTQDWIYFAESALGWISRAESPRSSVAAFRCVVSRPEATIVDRRGVESVAGSPPGYRQWPQPVAYQPPSYPTGPRRTLSSLSNRRGNALWWTSSGAFRE
uniref:Putative secreted protein n=1 Tax=Anopheles triannulatus TaxID=58253 RepID=A0A2M4B144_9DIPT